MGDTVSWALGPVLRENIEICELNAGIIRVFVSLCPRLWI